MLNWFARNWSVKLLSLAIAVGLWVFVVGQEKSEILLRMPVEATNVPKGMTVIGDRATEVEVLVRGPRSLVRIAATQPRVKVLDLRGSRPGEQVFQVLPEDLKLPPGVQTVRISPATVRLELAKVAVRKLPVRPVLPGEPATGYRLGDITIKPDSVEARGLEQDVAELEKWVWTRPIDIHGIDHTVRVTVPVRLVWARERSQGGSVEVTPPYVQVVVPVLKAEPDHRPAPAGAAQPKKETQ